MFTVGRLAKQADLNIETIRYYQRIGLLRTPESEDGYRFYNQHDVERLKFIKRVKHAGLHLHEIAELLSLDHVQEHLRAQDIVAHYQHALEQRIQELKRLQQGLSGWLESHADNRQHANHGIATLLNHTAAQDSTTDHANNQA